MTGPENFDIFISHAHDDESVARELAGALNGRGVSTFHIDDLTPGDDWERRLEKALSGSRAVAIIVGADPYSDPYLSKEWSRIVESGWERPERRIVPLVRAGVNVPPFLRPFQCVRIDEGDVNETAAQLIDLLRSGDPSGRAVSSSGFRQRVQANERLIQQAVQSGHKSHE